MKESHIELSEPSGPLPAQLLGHIAALNSYDDLDFVQSAVRDENFRHAVDSVGHEQAAGTLTSRAQEHTGWEGIFVQIIPSTGTSEGWELRTGVRTGVA